LHFTFLSISIKGPSGNYSASEPLLEGLDSDEVHAMAETTTSTGVNPLIALLVGGLIVAVAALAFFVFSGMGNSVVRTVITKPVIVEPNRPSDAHHDWWRGQSDNHDQNAPSDRRAH